MPIIRYETHYNRMMQEGYKHAPSSEEDRKAANEGKCDMCKHVGLICSSWVKGEGEDRSLKVFASCTNCGYSKEV